VTTAKRAQEKRQRREGPIAFMAADFYVQSCSRSGIYLNARSGP